MRLRHGLPGARSGLADGPGRRLQVLASVSPASTKSSLVQSPVGNRASEAVELLRCLRLLLSRSRGHHAGVHHLVDLNRAWSIRLVNIVSFMDRIWSGAIVHSV